MKHIYLLSLLITSFAFAQLTPPAELQSYYSGVDFSSTGTTLYDDLAIETIAKHTNILSYAQRHAYLYDADEDLSNADNVILMYSSESRSDDEWLSGSNPNTPQTFNTEHVYPQSLLTEDAPKGDLHHLRSCDITINSNRGNKPFGTGSGSYADQGSTWYPGDEWKGDVARMMLYMNLRYNEPFADVGSLSLFLQWNAEDPVSNFEINRNTVITNVQGNRNPFIDNPYIATVIWGGPAAEDRWNGNTGTDTEAPTAPTNLMASSPTSNSINLSWTASTDNIGVASYDVYLDGVNTYTTSTSSLTATGLNSETNYCFTVYANDGSGNTSTASNTACETTTAPSSGGTDLFFSEYVEGSGFNKALEIVNLTGAPVDLSVYSIKRDGNGGGSWEAPLNLSGTIAADDVYVIINSDAADATLQAEADLGVPNSTPMTFNGNDPIGLFKNDVLIDIIGEFGDASNFASNVTLRRKSTISSPTIQFELFDEWDSYASNTVSDIGMHTSTLSRDSEMLNTTRIYPNPVKDNLLYIDSKTEASVEIFNVLGKRVINTNIGSSSYYLNISELNRGVYLVKVKTDLGTITKKLIRQ